MFAGFAGPRYSQDGAVIPHSLLGNYSDFKKIAVEKGDLLVCFNLSHFFPAVLSTLLLFLVTKYR